MLRKDRSTYMLYSLCGDSTATKAQLEASKRYLAKQDDIRIRVPKGDKDKIRTVAQKVGESLNTYIYNAIKQRVERDRGLAEIIPS